MVNRQKDGYNFVLLPSIREMIRNLIPNAHPANNIFVHYDWGSDFEKNIFRVESYIYPALLGIENQKDMKSIGKIGFIDTQTKLVVHSIRP